MRIGKTLRVAAMTLALAMAVTPALVDYADAGRGGGRGGGGGHGMRGGGGGHAMRGVGGGGRHYSGGGSRRYSGYSGSGSRRYSGGKHYSGNNYKYKHGHGYYRHGHGYGYWRGGLWIATGIVGYGGASYCSRLYYYNYSRWLYECQ